MALKDVQKAVAEEQARLAAEKKASESAAAAEAAAAKQAAKAEAKRTAKTKAEKNLVAKEAEYKKLINKLATGEITGSESAVLQGQAITLSDEIDTLKKKLKKPTEVSTTVPKPSTEAFGPGIPSKPATKTTPAKTKLTPAKIETVGAVTGVPSATEAARESGAFQLAGQEAAATVAADKTASAISKAIELYQMPDIIFNNVPELKAILDKYLDPKKPITLDQFVKEVGNSTWYRQNSKTIQNRFLQKFNYDDLKKQGLATGDTQYEKDIKTITENVISKARELGSPMDPTQAQLIAEDLYIHNMETDMTALTKRLAGSIRVTPLGTTGLKGYSGSAQANYQTLLGLAKNNGLNLRNILPTRIVGSVDKPLTDEELTNNVLAGLADGSIDISTIQQTARVLASQGQPQYIKDLLAQGYDLSAIYAPYKKIMANTLEIDPNQIDLNDPALRMAITPNGDMNTYDYQKMLRKDNRWQYTQQANQEVSNITQKVLQDFGFMG